MYRKFLKPAGSQLADQLIDSHFLSIGCQSSLSNTFKIWLFMSRSNDINIILLWHLSSHVLWQPCSLSLHLSCHPMLVKKLVSVSIQSFFIGWQHLLRYHDFTCYGRFHGPVSTADASHAGKIASYRSGK